MYKKFNALLERFDITAYKVSKETGVSTSTLSDWKNGRSNPKIDKLQKIASYFGVPVTYFLD
ncbi:helix-turn-helix domain-containing protein [Turicibacter sanguinis]|uniref:helix-turn-helix domain-containing protein n=1 Tax=Turicibacter sanguinis TaxID=154288 RepID=UPI0012BC9BD1|nr:helix-turn-helix transcriptional regulator [Turicibacter sanguinis]MCU7201574.1 helix-turn-helix domain-containing protein [Turicibacter sanguinis]MTN45524.1 helix-turn-helix domain-containing protein [Turicibacter sanguinis]MTN51345.1 helix-turn-helix domain-containing protein [Turicibacter sanguinis]MTN54453.1 helix-turn-helix domain-containing protein [Turicibacter sanguinis]MTN57586.1 helix-turn-helix domain-containing protein [Turicibacter sanguinis]